MLMQPINQTLCLSLKKKPAHTYMSVCVCSFLLFFFVYPEAPETGSTVIILVVASGFDKKARDDRNPISSSSSSVH